jgi:hypothetical protein
VWIIHLMLCTSSHSKRTGVPIRSPGPVDKDYARLNQLAR